MKEHYRRAGWGVLVAGLTWAGCASCSGAEEETRSRWLQHVTVEDNLIFLQRDPELAGGKLVKMGESPYAWMRGSLGHFLRDQAQAAEGLEATAFASPGGARVLLVGDPHVENIGTFPRLSGELVVAFNDFDAATWGPWISDLRRLALSFWLVAEAAGAERPDAFAVAVAQGYLDGVAAEPLMSGDEHKILDDLIKKALENGNDRAELADYTEVREGARRLRLGVIEPPDRQGGVIRDEVRGISPEERAALVRAVEEELPQTLAGPVPPGALRVKDAGRRLGAGVSSYPALRYYVLVEGPTPALEDDWLLEVKETLDPASFPNLAGALPPRAFGNNAERAVRHQRALQGETLDPLLGRATVGGASMKVRDRTKYQRGLDVARILERMEAKRWSEEDLQTLAVFAGRLLAQSHCFGPMLDGGDARAQLRADLGARPEALLDELRAFAQVYGPARSRITASTAPSSTASALALGTRHERPLEWGPGGRCPLAGVGSAHPSSQKINTKYTYICIHAPLLHSRRRAGAPGPRRGRPAGAGGGGALHVGGDHLDGRGDDLGV